MCTDYIVKTKSTLQILFDTMVVNAVGLSLSVNSATFIFDN